MKIVLKWWGVIRKGEVEYLTDKQIKEKKLNVPKGAIAQYIHPTVLNNYNDFTHEGVIRVYLTRIKDTVDMMARSKELDYEKGGEKIKITDEQKEKAIEEMIKRTISHEAGHEGYFYARDLDTPNIFREYVEKPERQEYAAYTSEFPNNPYLKLKNYLKHPATTDKSKIKFVDSYFGSIGVGTVPFKTNTKAMAQLIRWVDSLKVKSKGTMKPLSLKDKNKIVALELGLRARNAGMRGKEFRQPVINKVNDAYGRYGIQNLSKENKTFLRRIFG